MEGQKGAPLHYRALGRSAFLAAALHADKKLDAIARSYDFLLSLTPINAAEAMHAFVEGQADKAPHIPLPAADRRSRQRQARPLCDRPDPARGPDARAAALREAARARLPADHAGDAQHAGVPAGLADALRRGRPAPARRRARDPRRAEEARASGGERRRRRARSPTAARALVESYRAPTRASTALSRSATTSPGCSSRATN